MESNPLVESYEKLMGKYMLVLDKLGIISRKLHQSEVDITELQKIVSDTITEVTLKLPI